MNYDWLVNSVCISNHVCVSIFFLCGFDHTALRAFLNNQTEDILDEGGPIIQLDGLDPPMYNESSLADLQTWILIASTSTLLTISLL